ncbi:ribbon-helix-helix domain-containing protein [Priestia megaterium]|uniref:ribbon-helix-helix domain-containing protein n=1 Tax=Priestia megaterium TaxID=1404 RepID=UPI002877267F|nr:ribbon-helix-helix domain-containing protein [Priestia megaterium]
MSENRGLKTRRALSNAIKIELYEQLKQLSDDTKIPMSKLLDEAVEDLLKKRSPLK